MQLDNYINKSMVEELMAHSPCFTSWKNKDLRYEGASHKQASFLGLASPHQMLDKNDYDFCCANNAEHYQKCDYSVLTGAPWSGIEMVRSNNSIDNVVLTSKVPVQEDEHSEIIGVFVSYYIIEDKTKLSSIKEEIAFQGRFHNDIRCVSNKVSHYGFKLTQREAQCLYFTLRGYSASSVGDFLNLSRKTIEYHLENTKFKLGCKNKSQLFERAFELKIIEFAPEEVLS